MKDLRGLDRYLIVLVVVLLFVSGAYLITRALPVVSFPYTVDVTEPLVFDQARRIVDHPGQYPALDAEPYLVDRSPPVYPFLLRHLPTTSGRPFTSGRTLTLAAMLLAAVGMALLVRRAALSAGASGALAWVPALLAPGAFLTTPEVDTLATAARPEALALALGCWGFLALHAARRPVQWVGVVLLVGALFTCHTFLALPVVAVVSLWWRDPSYRRFAALVAGIVVASVLLAIAITGGGIYTHLVQLWFADPSVVRLGQYWLSGMKDAQILTLLAVALAFLPRQGTGSRGGLFACLALLIVLGACEWYSRGAHREIATTQEAITEQSEEVRRLVGALEEATRNQDADGMKLVPLIQEAQAELVELQHRVNEIATDRVPAGRFWLLVSLAAAGLVLVVVTRVRAREDDDEGRSGPVLGADARGLLLALGVLGAMALAFEGTDVGTRLEFLAVLAIVCAVPIAQWPVAARAAMVVVLFAASILHLAGMPDRPNRPERLDKLEMASAQLQARLRQVEGPILANDPRVPILVGQPLRYHPFVKKLHDAGSWDPRPLIEAIERRQYHAIVVLKGALAEQPFAFIDGTEIPDEVLSAMVENYQRREGANVTLADGLVVKRYEILFRK